MDFRFVAYGSREWSEARKLRYLSFFQALGLPESIMDDDEEAHGAHLVVSTEGKVVGYGRLFNSGNGAFNLSQLVVAPSHQRKGIGTTILEVLINEARSSGGRTVKLKARVPAVPFYQAVGFQQDGEAFPSMKTGIPHVTMTLNIEGLTE